MSGDDDYRNLVVQKITVAIWVHGLKTSGTASAGPVPQQVALAEAIADVFTCTECGFVDVGIGNTYGECNDCAPRLAARNRCESHLLNTAEGDECSCMKAKGHDGRHKCSCDERWTDGPGLTR